MRKYGRYGTEVSPALIVQRLRALRVGSTPRGVSRFRGVSKTKHRRTKEWTGRWVAAIRVKPASGGKSRLVHLGYYDIELDAARAYDAALMTVEGIEPEDRNMPDDPIPTPAEIEATRAFLADFSDHRAAVQRAAARAGGIDRDLAAGSGAWDPDEEDGTPRRGPPGGGDGGAALAEASEAALAAMDDEAYDAREDARGDDSERRAIPDASLAPRLAAVAAADDVRAAATLRRHADAMARIGVPPNGSALIASRLLRLLRRDEVR